MSVLGLGCNQIGRTVDRDGARRLIDECEASGVTLVDTADTYGEAGTSEEFLGDALAGARRERFVVATKFGMQLSGIAGMPDVPRGSREYIRWAVEGSLRRLQTDHIDLYQYHRPDGVTPLEETLGAMNELVGEGRVRFIGCSNFDAGQVDEAARIAEENGWAGFVSVQNEYSLLDRGLEADVAPACERHGLGIIPYFPLARGLLTGKYRRGEAAPEGARLSGREEIADAATFDKVEALERYAEERGVSLLEVAIGGLAAQPAVATVIAGATRPDQIAGNARAARWVPSDDDLRALDEVAPPPTA
ncbi:MAG TPA: aldo/keto reductase [Thermoleophilaceae bacterium]|nr:aldo/keto reductase [Thermoleophilaceae bacterium]